MASKPGSPAIEWRDDAKPFALCMMCDKEFPALEARCPQCQSALSLVHRCSGCNRVVSAKHLRCPYCSQSFLLDDGPGPGRRKTEDAAAAALRRQFNDARLRGQARKVLWFCTAVFLTVFVLAVAVQRYSTVANSEPAVLGSSFVLHEAVLRQSGSSQGAVIGKVSPPAVVEIVGFQPDGAGRDWFQIKWGRGTAYLPVSSLAPPKGRDADSAYTLLKVSLSYLADPAELGDAGKAVQLYRERYPTDRRGEELLWLLAEKGRALGLLKHDSRALAEARKAYSEVAREHGKHATEAEEALAEFSGASAKGESRAARPSSTSGGPAGERTWGVYDDKTGAHKFMLLDETEVSVVLATKEPLKEGEMVTGQIARAVVSNGDTVIPAGSPVRIKVTGRKGLEEKGLVELSLVEIQLGGRDYPVEAAPVQVRWSPSLSRSRLLFRLRHTLILAQ